MKKEIVLDSRTLPLEPNHYYHIYNRGNNKSNIFFKPENYDFFLKRYAKYLSEYLDTFAYCLLPNHFHFLIKIKPTQDLIGLKDLVSLNKSLITKESIEKILTKEISNRFRLLFMSYAKAINKQEDLTGSLFQKVFRRKRIDDTDYLLTVVGYIHANAYYHGVYHSIEDYQYSSYKSILSNRKTLLKREIVLEWFGGKNAFIESHKALIQKKIDRKYWIDLDDE